MMRHRVLEEAWSVWRAVCDSKIALEASISFLKSLGKSHTTPYMKNLLPQTHFTSHLYFIFMFVFIIFSNLSI